jgi:hypothetical protein
MISSLTLGNTSLFLSQSGMTSSSQFLERNRDNFVSFALFVYLILRVQWGWFCRKLRLWGFLYRSICLLGLLYHYRVLFVFHSVLMLTGLATDVEDSCVCYLWRKKRKRKYACLLSRQILLFPSSRIRIRCACRKSTPLVSVVPSNRSIHPVMSIEFESCKENMLPNSTISQPGSRMS